MKYIFLRIFFFILISFPLRAQNFLNQNKKKEQKEIYEILENSSLLQNHFVGFSLYDQKKENLFVLTTQINILLLLPIRSF